VARGGEGNGEKAGTARSGAWVWVVKLADKTWQAAVSDW
jgi:hypothetical protein